MSIRKLPQIVSRPFAALEKVFPWEYIMGALAAAYCNASFWSLYPLEGSIKELARTADVDHKAFIFTFLAGMIFLVVAVLWSRVKAIIPAALVVSAVAYAALLANRNANNVYFLLGLAVVLFVVVAWVVRENKLQLPPWRTLPRTTVWAAAIVLAVLFTYIVGSTTILRYRMFMAHNYDFGIFAQMFERMRETGLPLTTLERNRELSHFAVHFSPFYYLLLPFYAIAPGPETILWLQAAFVAMGVFPVILIAEKLGIGSYGKLMCVIMYIFYPSLANACLYDFHENKFLTVAILWLIYAVISKRLLLLALFALITLSIKEDAAIYVMAVALFMIFSRKERLRGGILFGLSVCYFLFATHMIVRLGGEVMVGRMDNYMLDRDAGFAGVLSTIIFNFGYFLSELFKAEKFPILLWMFLPVGFAPFFAKKKSLLLLNIPFVVVMLMSNWPYQSDIDYQYTYGAAALIVGMTVMVIASCRKAALRRGLMLFSAAMCIVVSFGLFIPRANYYKNISQYYLEDAQLVDSYIATLPKDETYVVEGFYAAHMYNFPQVYMYPNQYPPKQGPRNIVAEHLLVGEGGYHNNTEKIKDFIETNEYVLVEQVGTMMHFQLPK